MPHTWRNHRHPQPTGNPPPPPVYRNYNPGHYTAINDTQRGNAIGQDSGSIVIPSLGGTIQFSASGIPGGHLRTAGAWTATSGPIVGPVDGNGAIVSASGSRGVVIPYWWSQLETARGVYDMSELIADVAVCQYLGIQLIARIDTRTFSVNNNPAPGDPNGLTDNARYLNQLPYSIQYTGSGGGYQISRWNKTGTQMVRTRWKLLIDQVYAAVGDHPNFEGIATQETAGGLTATEETQTGYDPDDYLAALELEIDVTNAVSKKWRHFGYTNYIPGKAGETNAQADARVSTYFQYMVANGQVPGNPDILPDSSGIQNRVYPNFITTYGNTHPADGPTFSCAQPNSFQQSARTLQQLMDFATNTGVAIGNVGHLKVDYIMWQLQTSLQGAGSHVFDSECRLCITGKPVFNTYAYPP